MLTLLLVSAVLNLILAVTIAFLRYLLHGVTVIANTKPIDVQRGAPAASQVALRTSEKLVGLTQAEEQSVIEAERQEAMEARRYIAEDLGYDPDVLARITSI